MLQSCKRPPSCHAVRKEDVMIAALRGCVSRNKNSNLRADFLRALRHIESEARKACQNVPRTNPVKDVKAFLKGCVPVTQSVNNSLEQVSGVLATALLDSELPRVNIAQLLRKRHSSGAPVWAVVLNGENDCVFDPFAKSKGVALFAKQYKMPRGSRFSLKTSPQNILPPHMQVKMAMAAQKYGPAFQNITLVVCTQPRDWKGGVKSSAKSCFLVGVREVNGKPVCWFIADSKPVKKKNLTGMEGLLESVLTSLVGTLPGKEAAPSKAGADGDSTVCGACGENHSAPQAVTPTEDDEVEALLNLEPEAGEGKTAAAEATPAADAPKLEQQTVAAEVTPASGDAGNAPDSAPSSDSSAQS